MFSRKYFLVFALLCVFVVAYIHAASNSEEEKAKRGPKVTDKVRKNVVKTIVFTNLDLPT